MSSRAESGKMQFGDDWPGVFLRGDYAGPMGFHLTMLIERLKALPVDSEILQALRLSPYDVLRLEQLRDALSGSHVRSGEEPQRLRAWQECLPASPLPENPGVQEYIKLPVKIQAVRLPSITEEHDPMLRAQQTAAYLGKAEAMINWIHTEGLRWHHVPEDAPGDPEWAYMEGGRLVINTLEGEMRAEPGDWIIRGVEGEFYPCKHSIFSRTYRPAAPPAPAPALIGTLNRLQYEALSEHLRQDLSRLPEGGADDPLAGHHAFTNQDPPPQGEGALLRAADVYKDAYGVALPPGPPVSRGLTAALTLRRPHVYPGVVDGTFERSSRCSNGCGAFMGGSRSHAPEGVDPFGECPQSPVQPLKVRYLSAPEGLNAADSWLRRKGITTAQFEMLYPEEGRMQQQPAPDYSDRFIDQDGSRPCIQCQHCTGQPHHWNAEAGYLGYSAEEPEHPAALAGFEVWLECKHCPAWRVESEAEERDLCTSEDDPFEPAEGFGALERQAMALQKQERSADPAPEK